MRFLTVVLTGVVLNISGVVIGKYITFNFNHLGFLAVLLFFYATIQVARLAYWFYVGKKYQLSYIYPILSINYLFSFILGILLFNEIFLWHRLVGSLTIVTGVVIMSLSKNKREEIRT